MYARCADQAGDTETAATRWTDLLVRHPDHEPAYAAAVSALVKPIFDSWVFLAHAKLLNSLVVASVLAKLVVPRLDAVRH
jgi:hypothetical protein